MLSLTLPAIIVSAVAMVIAIGNLRRSKRLKLKLAEQTESLETQILSLHEMLRQATLAAEQSRPTDWLSRIESLEQRQQHYHKQVDHLFVESQNMAMLPTWHPTRVELVETLRPRMDPILSQLVPVLFPNQIALDAWDWMYRLQDRKFPYSLTFEEGMLMHHLIASNGLTSGYEIATAFGFSSFFIATAFEKTAGHLISADAYIEEEMEDFIYDLASTRAHVEKLTQLHRDEQFDELPRGLQFAIRGAQMLGIQSCVDYRIACSPEGVAGLLGDRKLDFAFIDGGHFGEQPILDVQSVLPYLQKDRFLMMFHDTQCEAVAKAVHFAARSLGVEPFSIHTRNRIVAVAKGIDPQTLQACRAMTVRQVV